jgi:hypothetical protein
MGAWVFGGAQQRYRRASQFTHFKLPAHSNRACESRMCTCGFADLAILSSRFDGFFQGSLFLSSGFDRLIQSKVRVVEAYKSFYTTRWGLWSCGRGLWDLGME